MPRALKGDGGSGVDKTLCGVVKADSMSCSCWSSQFKFRTAILLNHLSPPHVNSTHFFDDP